MTNEERSSVNEKALRDIANQIEEIRIELYSCNTIDNETDKVYVDDELFRFIWTMSCLDYSPSCVTLPHWWGAIRNPQQTDNS